jgi:hypothetical protein
VEKHGAGGMEMNEKEKLQCTNGEGRVELERCSRQRWTSITAAAHYPGTTHSAPNIAQTSLGAREYSSAKSGKTIDDQRSRVGLL